nr:uncharacterized protein LOC128674488 [Plodia interpunctella]
MTLRRLAADERNRYPEAAEVVEKAFYMDDLKLWNYDLKWDDEIPNELCKEWVKIRNELPNINQYKVPRWIRCCPQDVIELHGFCDASIEAYAKNDPVKQQQLMGDLPSARTEIAPAFFHTGVDYTGSLEVKANRTRNAASMKGYVALFICMVTKAIHLELVTDLSSSAFLAALRRMSARRGTPRHIYSDCGTNFVSANNILQEETERMKQIFDEHFMDVVTSMNIQWHFNAPKFPSSGGLWERAVRSVKFHLKRVVGAQRLTFEEYSTLLAQLEACLNSRPLCAITENIDDLDCLTPAHFLTGRAGVTVIETPEDGRTRWHLTNELFKQIWKKWRSEYLTELNVRSKWRRQQTNIQIGDLVTIQDENLSPGKWPMARVTELHPGKDGLVRVVTLKTQNGY